MGFGGGFSEAETSHPGATVSFDVEGEAFVVEGLQRLDRGLEVVMDEDFPLREDQLSCLRFLGHPLGLEVEEETIAVFMEATSWVEGVEDLDWMAEEIRGVEGVFPLPDLPLWVIGEEAKGDVAH